MMQYINPDEAIKRLAAAQGIDVLNLVKNQQQIQQEQQAAMMQQAQGSLVGQAGQILGTPMMDPEKNPEGVAVMAETLGNATQMAAENQQQPPIEE